MYVSIHLPAKRFTDSITSRNTSFFRYFTPSVRHDTAFVTAGGGLGAISSLWPKIKEVYFCNQMSNTMRELENS